MKTASMIASEFNPFANEARYFCHEHGIDDPETMKAIELDLRHKAFMQAIQPIIKLMVRIDSYSTLTHLVHPGGLVERVGDGLSDGDAKMRAELEKMIADKAVQFGLKFGDEVPDDTTAPHSPE